MKKNIIKYLIPALLGIVLIIAINLNSNINYKGYKLSFGWKIIEDPLPKDCVSNISPSALSIDSCTPVCPYIYHAPTGIPFLDIHARCGSRDVNDLARALNLMTGILIGVIPVIGISYVIKKNRSKNLSYRK